MRAALRFLALHSRTMPTTTGDIVSKILPADGTQPYTCVTA